MTRVPLSGSYRQGSTPPFAAYRKRMLALGQPLPPSMSTIETAPSLSIGNLAEIVQSQLASLGAAAVSLDRPLPTASFVAFGEILGTPLLEDAPELAPYVEDGVVLNLVTRSGTTDDAVQQPFASNWLSLHTEKSGAPVERQPRYIVLMCLHPGPAVAGALARTVLVRMSSVVDNLTADTRAVLATTRYAGKTGSPPLLRVEGGQPILCCRDFCDADLRWTHTGEAGNCAAVNAAIEQLYMAMYDSGACILPATIGLLAVIDNQAHFHGRTAAPSPRPDQTSARRHIKRLRILAPAP